ncbi:hypothetical protein M9Y10_043423 [Tritrichomonas musculus]|uniref:DUF3447 domain-containing protein n=1 Tax=Tritrichomonas musculus TaxID=1915356 RepID=A0ABR2K2J7_9EUKA
MIQGPLSRLKDVQNDFLEFIDSDNEKLIGNLVDQKIYENRQELRAFLHILFNISNNHYRNHNFFQKIFQILVILKNDIINFFSNDEIFNIFKDNKRILLFLIEEKIITITKSISLKMIENEYYLKKYPHYFFQEIKTFINNDKIINKIKEELPEDYETQYENLRSIGENENYICQLIRNDDVVQFIKYINQNNYSLNSQINNSIFETNSFLSDKKPTFIEYSAFYGSIQIYKFLIMNQVQMTDSLCFYAIHGLNPELFHMIEENNEIKISYEKCLMESIMCHHNDFAKYFIDNFIQDINEKIFKQSLKYYNMAFIEETFINESILFELCKYDWVIFVDKILENNDIDINMKKILTNLYSFLI